jgi:AraC-like DNA-binding protein
LYPDAVDVLSDAIMAMRTGRPHSTRYDLHAPWGMRFPASTGAGFHVVLQGSCWLIPPRPEPPIALGVGDVVLGRSGMAHGLADSLSSPLTEFQLGPGNVPYSQVRWEGSGPPTVLLCGAYALDQSRTHPLLAEVPPIVHLPARVSHHSSLRAAVELLGSEIARPLPGIDAIVPALLDTLLLYMLRAWFEQESSHEGSTGWVAALSDPAIVVALAAIHQEPAYPWTVAELGTRAGLSRAAFARRFTAQIGQPPLAYVTWWRLTKAAHFLRESDAPLRVVAKRAGYTSEIAFAAAFKREYGLTPARYRADMC